MTAKDNVATVLDEVAAGDVVDVSLKNGDKVAEVTVGEDVPLYHKFALADIAAHELVIKYGEVIGETTQAIRRGQYVHVHNIASVKTRDHD